MQDETGQSITNTQATFARTKMHQAYSHIDTFNHYSEVEVL